METITEPGGTTVEVSPSTLLLVDDEENILAALRRLLRRDGYRILCANSGQAGLEILAQEQVDLIISDQRMPHMVGTVFLAKARELSPHSVRMILSGYTDLESVTAAINDGAVYKFLTKPWEDDILRLSIREALRHKWVEDENRMLQGMLVEVNDELARANRALAERAEFAQESLASYQQILNSLPQPLLGVDDQGKLAFANPAARQLFGPTLQAGQAVAPALPEALAEALAKASPTQLRLTIAGQHYCVQLQPLTAPPRGCLITLFGGCQAC